MVVYTKVDWRIVTKRKYFSRYSLQVTAVENDSFEICFVGWMMIRLMQRIGLNYDGNDYYIQRMMQYYFHNSSFVYHPYLYSLRTLVEYR